MKDYELQLKESLGFGFIDQTNYKNDLYAPKILKNDEDNNKYILTDIQEELRRCKSFKISVAFLNSAGINMLKAEFHDLSKRGGQGQIIISPYLGFNDPDAMRELLKLKGVEVRLAPEEKNLHAKFYYFEQNFQQIAVVGSANLTDGAFKKNYEWNVKLNSTENGNYVKESLLAFESLWVISTPLTEGVIRSYEKNRQQLIRVKAEDEQTDEENKDDYHFIHPNRMQKNALQGIAKMRQLGQERALVISATGTGKTFLGAFDVRNYQPKRFLFVVHREQILRKAQASFQKVIGFDQSESVIYKSGMNIQDKKYVFATIQSISRQENLKEFDTDHFDYILIDEVHKAGAPSYQKFMTYFQPDFYLGMTATPERSDDYNIYELFDHNVAYEIRLQQALEENMLCPFIYYGVSDLSIDHQWIDEKSNFQLLTSDIRVQHLNEKIQYYSVSGVKTKGLIFCSTVKEAEEISNKMNQLGYHTRALSGKDSQEQREASIKKLEKGELDYLLTVDIFNEGVDIPSINQVIMLRHTESAIIFVQQLGRGLRKHPQKEFVTVIDFIGNYKNNFLIPIALYGDQSFNKDNYRRKLTNRTQLSGLTTINFEEIASKQIFNSLKNNNLSTVSIIKEKYIELENRLGRTPYLYDFLKQDSMDPLVIFENPAFKHYGDVIEKFSNDDKLSLNEKEEAYLSFMTKELLNGKRPHELILLSRLFKQGGQATLDELKSDLSQAGASSSPNILESVKRVLNLSFYKDADRKKYGEEFILFNKNNVQLGHKDILLHDDFLLLAQDIIQTALHLSRHYPAGYTDQVLELGKKYSRKDACRLLCWKKDESSVIYGYRSKYGSCPLFVNYHKSEDISESTQYSDAFINQRLFHWYSRPKRYITSDDVQEILNHKELQITVPLFVKKDEANHTEFYYLGNVDVLKESAQEKLMPSGDSVVTMDLELAKAVPYPIYHYLITPDLI